MTGNGSSICDSMKSNQILMQNLHSKELDSTKQYLSSKSTEMFKYAYHQTNSLMNNGSQCNLSNNSLSNSLSLGNSLSSNLNNDQFNNQFNAIGQTNTGQQVLTSNYNQAHYITNYQQNNQLSNHLNTQLTNQLNSQLNNDNQFNYYNTSLFDQFQQNKHSVGLNSTLNANRFNSTFNSTQLLPTDQAYPLGLNNSLNGYNHRYELLNN